MILRFHLLLILLEPIRRGVSSCVKRQFYRNAISIALQLRARTTDPRGKGGAAHWHSPCAFTRLFGVGSAEKKRAEQVCAFSLDSDLLSLVSDFDGLTCGGLTAVDDSICVLIAQGKNALFRGHTLTESQRRGRNEKSLRLQRQISKTHFRNN